LVALWSTPNGRHSMFSYHIRVLERGRRAAELVDDRRRVGCPVPGGQSDDRVAVGRVDCSDDEVGLAAEP
jgi:hypothetical protein